MTLAINARFLTQKMSGVQRFSREVVTALAATGHPIRLLAPPGAPGEFAGLPVERIGRRSGQAWEQFDLPGALAGCHLLNLGNTAPLRVGGGQTLVIHDAGVFDTPESYSFAFRAWYRALHWTLPRRGARIVTVSEFSRARLSLHLGLPAARIGVMAEGGEHALRDTAEPDVLARHGLQPGRFVLAVGTRAAHKNLDALRDAVALLAARGMKLAVAGAADAGVFRNAGDVDSAVALGRVSDGELRALYEAALCLIFPSRYEGFGLPPLEAMWCGCPVLAAAAGAVPEVCGDAALWFDAEGPNTPAAALARLLEDPFLAEHLRLAGRARAATFSWPAAADRLLGLLELR
ncbi:glycosyltransferase family 1 protein [Falsiroseomonas sp.]|uniref:glycosyltransferase family 4 protein n=1 Tax=Falsiroseomonas sp. TaxID=2870721 RepID=UPI0027256DFB|nr:glycosyltransferase family 1 protein [Falsiroseomonas sp.]MDO9501055.1 glycosyltransferase family 1 protein [Falsiroseomonas sp.]